MSKQKNGPTPPVRPAPQIKPIPTLPPGTATSAAEPTCATCIYFKPFGKNKDEEDVGQCRRGLVILFGGVGMFGPKGAFPEMPADEWCGEHKQK